MSDKFKWMSLAAHQKSWHEAPFPRRAMAKETLPHRLEDQAELQPVVTVMSFME